MQKITPFFWFNDQAEEAVNFYVSLFDDAKITSVQRYEEGMRGPTGQVMTMSFQLDGQDFMALNGGPQYSFTEAISFFVDCPTQEKIDRLWNAFADGGEEMPCGWIKDKYGVTWQLVPTVLNELLYNADPEKSKRVMQAMFQMKKLEIKTLEEA
jgi:predicted 3-demethylubiquinone-9 3-methyltransferase (glyoxalase superfamily)